MTKLSMNSLKEGQNHGFDLSLMKFFIKDMFTLKALGHDS